MNFERGIDPKDALQVGSNYRKLRKGDKFIAEFKLKKSYSEFYPLPKKYHIIAEATDDEKIILLNARAVRCKITEVPGEYFWGWYDRETKRWGIE